MWSRTKNNLELRIDTILQFLYHIMQNGNDFWLIDMARASESALSDCVPKEKLRKEPLPFLAPLKELNQ